MLSGLHVSVTPLLPSAGIQIAGVTQSHPPNGSSE